MEHINVKDMSATQIEMDSSRKRTRRIRKQKQFPGYDVDLPQVCVNPEKQKESLNTVMEVDKDNYTNIKRTRNYAKRTSVDENEDINVKRRKLGQQGEMNKVTTKQKAPPEIEIMQRKCSPRKSKVTLAKSPQLIGENSEIKDINNGLSIKKAETVISVPKSSTNSNILKKLALDGEKGVKEKLQTFVKKRGICNKRTNKKLADEMEDSYSQFSEIPRKKLELSYECTTDNCSEIFGMVKEIASHKRHAHKELFRHICSCCGKEFGSFAFYRSHIRMEHSDKDSLEFRMKNVNIIALDVLNVDCGNILVCPRCGFRFVESEDLSHNCEPMKLCYFCPCCPHSSNQWEDMAEHISEKHEGECLKLVDTDERTGLNGLAKTPGSGTNERRTKCEICNTVHASESDLKRHMDSKHATHPFVCGLCKKNYGRKTALQKHMMTHRPADLTCGVCKKVFYKKNKLDRHMLTHTAERPHQCEICGVRYREERDVQRHVLLKHVMNTKSTEKSAKKPKHKTKASSTICPSCGKSYSSTHALTKHMKTHKKSDIFRCPDCNLTFNEIPAFKQHKLVHQTLDFSMVGHIKNISQETLQEVYKEIKIFNEGHPSGKPYQCGICVKRFSKLKSLYQHIRVIHTREEDKDFVCDVCKRGFTLKAALQTHMRLHTDLKPYKCRLCNKQYRQLGHVKDHLLSHGKPQLQCCLCKKMFKTKTNLRQHVYTHCKVLPYKCPVNGCTAAFHRILHFLKHFSTCMKPVDVSTLLECNFCQETFTKDDIIPHFHSHENDVKFTCEPCGMLFGNYPDLFFHKKQHSHFMESEYEAPSYNKIVNNTTGSETVTDLGEDELMSQYDYIEDESIAVESDKVTLQETDDTSTHTEQSKTHLNMNVEEPRVNKEPVFNQLILIAEQLTNMASGLPNKEVIFHTTENDTVTEITVEGVDDAQQTIQVVIESGFDGEAEHVMDGQNVEAVGDSQSVEAAGIGQTWHTTDSGGIEVYCQVSEENCEDITQEQTQTVSSELTLGESRQTNSLPSLFGQHQEEPPCDDMQCNTTENIQHNAIDNVQYVIMENVQCNAIDNVQCNTVDNTLVHNALDNEQCNNIESMNNNNTENGNNAENIESYNMENIQHNTVDYAQSNKVDSTHVSDVDVVCSVCDSTFTDDIALAEHVCEEEINNEVKSVFKEDEKNPLKESKPKIRVLKHSKKMEISNDFPPQLKELNKNSGVVFQCTTGTCSKQFASIHKISRHKKLSHNENLKQICNKCKKEFCSFHIFKSHLRMKHSDEDSIPFLVKNINIIINNEDNTIGREISVCTKCGYRYGELETPDHECEPRGLCYYCPCGRYESENLSEVGKHITDNHGDDFKETDMEEPCSSLRSAKREPGRLISKGLTTCDACGISFDTNDELKQHMNTKHAAHPFACGICKTCYGRKSALMKHMASHKNLDLKCEVCQKEFSQKSRLNVHKMIHTGERPYQCEVCGKRFLEERSVRKHLQVKHSDISGSNFVKTNFIVEPKRSASKAGSICHVCGKSFLSQCNLKRHVSTKHRAEDKKFQCLHCGSRFDNILTFKRHKITHQGLVPPAHRKAHTKLNPEVQEVIKYVEDVDEGHPSSQPNTCTICAKRFKNVKALRLHMRVIHTREEDKRIQCHLCQRGFQRRSAFNVHMRLHENVKPYKCRLCNKRYRQLGHIKDHLLSHGKPQLQCCLCKKMFKTKTNLRQHVYTHCKILPYKCPVNGCTAAFHSLLPLLTHSSECLESVAPKAPLKCNFCSETLSTSEIVSHYDSHENDVEFSCQVCGMSFNNYQRLFFHKEEKKHFVESEFENASNPVEKDVPDRSDIPVGDNDGKPDWSIEDLMLQYDYIMEEDCIMPTQVNSEENIDNGDVLEEVVENNDTDTQEVEVAEIIANDLYQGDVIYVVNDLSELTGQILTKHIIE